VRTGIVSSWAVQVPLDTFSTRGCERSSVRDALPTAKHVDVEGHEIPSRSTCGIDGRLGTDWTVTVPRSSTKANSWAARGDGTDVVAVVTPPTISHVDDTGHASADDTVAATAASFGTEGSLSVHPALSTPTRRAVEPVVETEDPTLVQCVASEHEIDESSAVAVPAGEVRLCRVHVDPLYVAARPRVEVPAWISPTPTQLDVVAHHTLFSEAFVVPFAARLTVHVVPVRRASATFCVGEPELVPSPTPTHDASL
jgi:hypothetical protein